MIGGLALLAWFGHGGVGLLSSTSDMFSQFRLQAATRMGYPITGPVLLLARPRTILEGGALLAAEPEIPDDDAAALSRSRRLIIDRSTIAIDIGSRSASGDVSVSELLRPLVARIVALDVQSLTLRDCVIKLVSKAGEPEILSNVDLQITPQRRGSASIVGQFTFIEQRLNLNATLAKPASGTADARWPLYGTISSSLFEARFDGSIAEEKGLRLIGAVDLTAPRLREIARWIGVGSPRAGNLEAMRLKGALDWTGGAMAFSNATLTLDGNEGVGAITITREAERTAVEGTLAFKQLDLKPYVTSTMIERTLLVPIFAATQPPTIASLLSSVDADLRISTDALVVPGISTGQGAIAITLKNGKLLADVAELAVEDGLFKGQMVVERIGTDPRYGLNGKLEGVQAGRLMQRTLGRNPLQGKADITVNLMTTGDTTSELITGLDGKANIVMREGGRLGFDLRALAQSARRSDLRGWQAGGASVTNFDELALALDVRRGVVHTTIVKAKSGAGAITGGGSINLPARGLDFVVGLGAGEPSPKAVATHHVLTLSGPWHLPHVTVEVRDDNAVRALQGAAPALSVDRK
jgi:AsmA protein